MTHIQLFLLLSCIIIGVVVSFVITISPSDDQGITGGAKHFTPGSFDAARNKMLAILSILFVSCILAINAISVRSQKKRGGLTVKQTTKEEDKKDSSTSGTTKTTKTQIPKDYD